MILRWVLSLIGGCFWVLYSGFAPNLSTKGLKPNFITTYPVRLATLDKTEKNPKSLILVKKFKFFFLLSIGTIIVIIQKKYEKILTILTPLISRLDVSYSLKYFKVSWNQIKIKIKNSIPIIYNIGLTYSLKGCLAV